MNRVSRLLLVASVALAGMTFASRESAAQCTYTDANSGVTYSLATPGYARFNQAFAYWTAIGVRGGASDDWDLGVYSGSAAFPTCVSGLLASSAAGGSGVDFVIGDFNSSGNALGTYYAKVNLFSGPGPTSLTQWDSGADVLTINDYPTIRNTGSTSVLEVWDVFLEAGKQYTLSVSHGGGADMKALLFRNPANAAYWVGRSGRVLETTSSGTYVAPSSDWYGVVVVNDNGFNDTYQVAIGTCDAPAPLASGVASAVSGISGWRSFAQSNGYFTAVATRSDDPAQDWDMQVFSGPSGAAWPTCMSPAVASSGFGSGVTDFVVGDFNTGSNPFGTYYVRASPFLNTSTAKIEWDDGPDQLVMDAAPITRSTDANDLIETWDVFLNGGQNFGINFTHLGAADVKVFIFHNPGAGYWVGRSSADLVSTGNTTYTAPASDWYSILVVNDNGAAGTYKLGISQCAALFAPANGSVYFSGAMNRLEFHPTSIGWTVFGAMNSPDAVGNWDLKLFRDATGGAYPDCPSTLITQSTQPAGKVDFVAGDFHVNPMDYYYAYPVPTAGASSNDKFEWQGGTGQIFLNDPQLDRSSFGYALLECWDVHLTAGHNYNFKFDVTSGAVHLLLMRNTGGSPFWATRAAAEFDATGSHLYTAPTSGWYAVVVVADDINLFGNFKLGIYEGNVAVDSQRPPTTRLASISPNPTRSGARIEYELREPATVEFQVRDVAGRVVAELSPGEHASGRWSETWNGVASDGHQLSAGLYFVSMRVAGRKTGQATVVLLK